MKSMKKPVIKTALIILSAALIICLYIFGSGMRHISDAYIGEFSVSEDGSSITFDTGVAGSAGYIGRVKMSQEGGKLYLDFMSAFGGFNGSIGAQSSFTLPLDAQTETIGIYRRANCYETVLQKDENGVWQRVKSSS